MRITDYLSEVVIVGDELPEASLALAGLRALEVRPAWAVSRDDVACRATLAAAAAHARALRLPGLLLVSADIDSLGAFSRHDDALVERLEGSDWDLLYLVHEDGRDARPPGPRSGWLHCDAPPRDVRALALSLPLLQQVLDHPLALGPEAALNPVQWLTLLSWQAARACRASRALALWPALARHAGAARLRVGL